MADPFSVFTGALTVADVCLRVAEYLRTIQKATKGVKTEIDSLETEINNFSNVYTALGDLCSSSAPQQQQATSQPAGVNDPYTTLWARAAELVREGHVLVEKLRHLLHDIIGKEPLTKFQKIEDVRKAIKLLHKNQDFERLRGRLTNLNHELNTMLTAINLTTNTVFRSETITSLEQLPVKLSQQLQGLGLQLRAQIQTLEKADKTVEPSIISAKAAVAFASLNEHFYVQKPDTSIWSGRQKYLESLKNAILNRESLSGRIQKRFVIHGIPGAGKTQFCCKFAQDYRESFWGIFWVDASSLQSAAESWKKIAKIGGKDANEEAGKYWLSNLHSPWLLIIDSADNSEEFIRTQFPSGERGCILITTRNPRLKIHATVGYLTLDKLEENEANELLRKATKHEPWDGSAKSSASSIARHLGYLPLALIHAGRAIFHQLCTLQGYIPFFNNTLDNFRRRKYINIPVDDEDDDGLGAFTSFDIIYSGLEAQAHRNTSQNLISKDAVELVNMFAFLHNNDIYLEILLKAGRNLQQAVEAPTNHGTAESSSNGLRPTTLLQRMKDLATTLYIKFIRPSPTLPHILRDLKERPFQESRARRAMDLLVRMSLLSESSESGSYSMHPLVHVWVRKRLGTSAQALWCGVAQDVLANSVKIPPMSDDPGDQAYYLRILHHVSHVRVIKEEVKEQMVQNFERANFIRSLLWASRQPNLTTSDALNSAKYSRVYMECSLFGEAEKLQRLVRGFVLTNFGFNSVIIVPISLALSVTLWHLGRPAEAQDLQEGALKLCRDKLGDKHAQTLRLMDALGETYWQRGWLKEAKALHQAAINGMQDRPELKRERLKAMTHLGHVHEWYTEFEIAKDIHEQATKELTDEYGADDTDTMVAKDSLAMTLLQMGGASQVRRAYDLMKDIYERRETKLGHEHLFTLWAACNLGRTLTARGSLENDSGLIDDAATIFQDGLAIIKRNLGPEHIGTLMGRMFYANTLTAGKRFIEAEAEFKDIAECQKNVPGARAGTHRDRLVTLRMLIDCYEVQRKYAEAYRLSGVVIGELDGLGGQNHPWRRQVKEKEEKLRAAKDSAIDDNARRSSSVSVSASDPDWLPT